MQERITCPAMYVDDDIERNFCDNLKTGFILCGYDCDRYLYIYHNILGTPIKYNHHNHTLGYLTNLNRFVHHDEAIQVAKDAGQIGGYPNYDLSSYDLYMEEKVLTAAIHIDDGIEHIINNSMKAHLSPLCNNLSTGFVVGGHRHRHALKLIVEFYTNCMKAKYLEGFLTNINRFVDKKEAAKIAMSSGQMSKKVDILYSEDLYF